MSSTRNNPPPSLPAPPSRARLHEHPGSLTDLIAVIGHQLTASSLMTPWEEVATIAGEANTRELKEQATELMDRHQFSGVPMVWNEQVRGVYVRHEPDQPPRFQGVRPEHFVGPQVRIVDLVRHMRDTQKVVVGVGAAEAPVGWLTYADFSKRPSRVLLFTIVAEVEYLLACALDIAHPDDSWIDLVPASEDPRRDFREELLQRRREAVGWDVNMPLTTFSEIGHLIRAASNSPAVLEMLGEGEDLAVQLLTLPELRNRIAHAVRPVIAGPKQIGVVADQLDRLLGWIAKWPERLNARRP
jgi:hypothetical protein